MPKFRYLRLCGVALVTASMFFTAVAFTNCSSQPASPLTATTMTSEQKESALYSGEPFAFDAIVDTISYNSCFNDGLRANGIFGFKVSASEVPLPGDGARSGVRLTKDFLDFIGTKIKPEYPATTISSTQLKRFITNSPLSGAAQPLIGLRYANNLSIRAESPESNQGVYSPGVDFFESVPMLTNKNFLSDLTDGIAFSDKNKVLSYGPRIADFNTADDSERSLTVDMGYNLKGNYFELYGNAVRNELNQRNTALTLTFHQGLEADGPVNPISPDPNELKKAYGRIFYLSFGAVVGAAHNSVPGNLLKNVEERDLSRLAIVSNANWSCRNFMVVRSQDQNDYCRPVDYSILATSNSFYRDAAGHAIKNFDLLKEIRRHYPASEWDVGVFANYAQDLAANGTSRPFVSHPAIPGLDADTDTNLGTGDQISSYLCVVPRQTSCYIPNVVNNVDQGVDYFPSSNPNGCYQVSYQNQGIVYNSAPPPAKLCAQWASTCVRTSYGY